MCHLILRWLLLTSWTLINEGNTKLTNALRIGRGSISQISCWNRPKDVADWKIEPCILPFGLSTCQYRYHLDMDGCIPKVLWFLDAGLLKSNRLKVDARPVEPPSKACFSGKFLEISQQFVWRCNVDGSEIRLSLTSWGRSGSWNPIMNRRVLAPSQVVFSWDLVQDLQDFFHQQ